MPGHSKNSDKAFAREPKSLKVCLIGAGVVGTGWAVVFARGGAAVSVYDECKVASARLRENANRILNSLGVAQCGQRGPIIAHETLESAAADADYVQESVSEDAEIKARVAHAVSYIAESAIIASSTSAIDPAEFLLDIHCPERAIVAHPFNPSYLLPLVEVVSSPATSPAIYVRVFDILISFSLSPVKLRKFVPGFVINRLQAAVINEALRLVEDGVISANDLDICMRDSIGLRWAFMGPFETMDLNADHGIGEYLNKYGGSYRALESEMKSRETWSLSSISVVETELRQGKKISEIPEARCRRDRLLQKILIARED